MSIVKQIHAFLEVSESFLRQTGAGVMSDGWSPLDGLGVVGNTENNGNGNQSGNAMPAYRQDGA
ncbi:hypothetical protein OKW30_005113 [Paraburkholderia sp. Clong3]|uniref:hypothetical protein n=1 Tax=unclassified Paraburkholderia TaxID=2615204 RepID=UPI0016074E6C|nr:hypothetical protein [Paraburkholderia sp. CI2]MBB5470610.1 hypothetical protein [Paraburkholderia sp. CI2]